MPLAHCPDVAAAAWLTARPWPWQRLVSFGPPEFPAYARLRFIPDPVYEGQSENDVAPDPHSPSEEARLRTALETLARHTRTPDDWYFCLWDGWGADIADGPKVVVPNRAYLLFRGRAADLGDWGAADLLWHGKQPPHPPEPAFVWPADHAWCIANDVDPHWAGIGAGTAAIDALLGDARLDVVRADPEEHPPGYR